MRVLDGGPRAATAIPNCTSGSHDADRDSAIVTRSGHASTDLYDKSEGLCRLAQSIVVLDLDRISVRRDLAKVVAL
jgi:hypothetical protein